MHEQIAQGLREHSAKKGMRFNILVTAVEIGGSIGLFHLARRLGASDVVSYLVGSIAPVVGGSMVWAKARKFSGASAAIFAFTALSAVIALIGSTEPKVLLYKDCAVTALIGLIFLGSCALGRKPLVFYMAQRYGDGWHPRGDGDLRRDTGRLPRLSHVHVRHQLSMGGVVPHPGRRDRADHPPDPFFHRLQLRPDPTLGRDRAGHRRVDRDRPLLQRGARRRAHDD